MSLQSIFMQSAKNALAHTLSISKMAIGNQRYRNDIGGEPSAVVHRIQGH